MVRSFWIVFGMAMVLPLLAANGTADGPGAVPHPQADSTPAIHGKNETLQELGTGIQPFNFHVPAHPATGTESNLGSRSAPARERFGPSPIIPNAPLPPLVPLTPHTMVTPQPIPPPAFGPSGHR